MDGDQVYAAETLLKERKRNGKTEYLVKWKGWSTKHNTWEPADNILDDRLISDFEERTKKPDTRKRKTDESLPAPAAKKRGRQSAAKPEPKASPSPSTSRADRASRRSRMSETPSSIASEEKKDRSESRAEEKPEPVKEKPAAKRVEASETRASPEHEDEAEELESETAEEKDNRVNGPAEVPTMNIAAPDETTTPELPSPRSPQPPVPKAASPQTVPEPEEHTEVENVEQTPHEEEKEAPASEETPASEEAPVSEETPVSEEAQEVIEKTPSVESIPEEDEISAQEMRQPKIIEPPLEIYVQRTDQVTSEENGTETKTIHAYSITQEGDPNTTHKLQMPGGTATFKPISTESQPPAEAKKEESNGDSSQERIEIIKSDLQNETVSNPILESVDANTDSD
uniref:Chromo domain-containing protein n=1 Tax=Acrobeloides nanus TaxID=290746 RepID=A0A914CX87_9BILA